MSMTATDKAKKYLLLISIFFLLTTAVSLALNIRGTQTQYRELATVMGRSFFQTIVATRKWNAEHGGVYVPITPQTQPNPFLEDPLRDVTTTGGMRLTKVNPAYMTRMVSEILRTKEIQAHITSLKPIRPQNKADEWETEVLSAFERGTPEETTLTRGAGADIFRYMAPLKVDAPCLKCHEKQGYKTGDIRGGISVSFSYAPFQTAMTGQNQKIIIIHLFFLAAGFLIIWFLGTRLIARVRELQEAQSLISKLENILPICSHCRKIRTDATETPEESWINLEEYLREKTATEFSHGICPACYKALYEDDLLKALGKQRDR
ncbi:MAG: hypothetical protein C0402_05605 [Thermodesulfovibrio sp.]|nr:hypothetical protein [Thermodesulfovibrio sp.]